ncbi:polysaccharide biosynthesis C-terminal domain-containing protein [Halosimplex aquaticum]|uniref:Polysaccharide biosynthesis C-terminal domain-containing protein n=1 Tax=Halosimplex aquaticum TaxID=3026162 RepID=A0ABD5XZ25_9EURY|nr:oligosaccharide flippase family protein [Halosimplex aquaticum]
MDLRDSVLKLFSGRIVVAVVEFAAIAGFTQALGTGPMGSFFVFQAVVGMLGVPVDLGISKAVEKQLSADEPLGEVLTTSIAVKGVLALPWIAGLVILTPRVEQYVGVEGVVPFIVVGLAVTQSRALGLRTLAGQLRVDENAFLKVIGKLVWVASGAALIHFGWAAKAMITAYILGRFATLLAALVRADLAASAPSAARARSLIDFGRYVFVGSVSGFVYQWMDVAILRLFVPVSMVGAYEIAWRVASVAMMLTEAIRTSLFPQISQWHADDRLDEIESAFRQWLQIPLYLTIPAFAGAVVIGREILGTLFGADVVLAYPVLIVFMAEKILRSVQLVLGPSLYAMDKPVLGYRGSVAAIVTNLVLNFALVPRFGIIGAAAATTLSAATAAAVAITYVSRFVDIDVPWRRIAWSVASAVLMAGAVAAVKPYLPGGVPRVALGVAAGAAIYFALLFVNEGIRLEMRGAIEDVTGSSP